MSKIIRDRQIISPPLVGGDRGGGKKVDRLSAPPLPNPPHKGEGIANEKELLRIIDANFNRAKEGLRVCEDVCRFILDDRAITRQFKTLRHRLSTRICSLSFGRLIECRNIDGDVGKSSTAVELKRTNVSDIFYANAQRSKESLRVLEEFAKLLNRPLAEDLKKIRYQIYAIEKTVIAQF